jgi:hypothetical protein
MDDFDKLKQTLRTVQRDMGDEPSPTRGNFPSTGSVSPGPQVGGTRLDPRTGLPLQKVEIPTPSGHPITIDVNPESRGVFLDKGELVALSKIPNVVGLLEVSLRNLRS